ncbi:MAG TPA: tetratricopeptide repeat protein, partial [Polyangiaceae bacterium]
CSSVKLGIERLEDLEGGAIPTTVHALIRARAEALEPPLLELLGAASVIGNEFPAWLLLKVAATPDAPQRLERLLQSGLLQATETPATFRFKHGLTREVVYDAVRIFERRELHRKVAETLESQFQNLGLADHYEVLAAHFARANQHRSASTYAELAGDKAAATSALDGARHHYAAALAQIDELPNDETSRRRWLAIVTKWSAACVYYPSREQLVVLARAARYAEELQDHQALALVLHWSGWIHYALGSQEPAIEHLKRALELSERGHRDRATAQLLVNLGQSYAASGEYEPALEFLNRGIDMKRRWQPPGVGGAYAIGCLALVKGDRGEFAAAHVHIQEALAMVRDTGNAVEGSLCGLLGMIQLWQGSWQDALQTAARGRATGERVNGHYVLAMCEALASYARWRLDRSLLALDSLARAVEWLERRDINLYLSFCSGHLARAELEAGRVELASEHALRTLERAERGDALGKSMAHRVLAISKARLGSEDEAREHCEKALRAAEHRASPREIALTELTLGELELGWKRPDAARALLETARARFQELHMPWHSAESDRLLHAR